MEEKERLPVDFEQSEYFAGREEFQFTPLREGRHLAQSRQETP